MERKTRSTPSRRAMKGVRIHAFIHSRASRQSENKMPASEKDIFRGALTPNPVRILTPDPLSSFSFFCSHPWPSGRLRDCWGPGVASIRNCHRRAPQLISILAKGGASFRTRASFSSRFCRESPYKPLPARRSGPAGTRTSSFAAKRVN